MSNALEFFAAALADRYVVERELGRGGNAVVYLAQDRKHQRRVAVKMLLPELALSVRSERFLREIEIVARLTHPNILPLYDSGEANGYLYYVMPYVAGETLRERLEHEPQLSLPDALQITREVADALTYAHQEGIVHRDIKPENILVEAGHAVVADFGLARALTAAADPTVSHAGIAMGTPIYMSPEQGAATGELDGRSDIYSLACVLYEMLAGHPPFTGGNAQEILARHAIDPVTPLRQLRPEVPKGVDAAIQVALAKRPSERFATVAEFAAALAAPETSAVLCARRRRRLLKWTRRVVAATAVALVAAVAVGRWRALAAPGVSATPSVAVLPFVNIGGDTANQYFSDGMTEELINALAQVEGLRVPGRSSSFSFQGRNVPVSQIGAALRVATVVEGSVRKSSRGLRVSARLVNVADGYQIWAEEYDRPLTDVVRVQEDIARAVAGALRVKLAAGGPATLARRYSDNPEAYDLYLRGRFFWYQRSRQGMLKAIDYFERVIALDSGYALAYSGLADAYLASMAAVYDFVPRKEAFVRAKAAALRAVALDSQLAEAYVSLGRVRQAYDWDWRGAEQAYRRAIQLNPRYALAHSWYGHFLAFVLSVRGRADEGVRETRLGVELDPLNAHLSNLHGMALRYARRYDEAIEYHQRAIELNPALAEAYYHVGFAYLFKGMYREALAHADTAARLDSTRFGIHPTASSWPPLVAIIYGRQGRRAEALAILREHEQRFPLEWTPRAYIYAALGDRERTLEALDHMVEPGVFWPMGPNLGSAHWDLVRSDPRFQLLLKKTGLQ